MPFVIAALFYVHASYCYGSWLAGLASLKAFSWLKRLGIPAVGRIADALAVGAAVAVYGLAGGFS